MAIFDRFRRNKDINPSADVMNNVQNIDPDEGYEVTKVREEDQRISTTLAYPSNDSIHQFLAAPVASDKFKRLNEYRAMSNHVEVSDAIDEVCDSVYSVDELGNFLNLDIKNDKKFTDRQRKILADEFKKFVDLYDFEKNIFNYARTFVVEGELAFENVIDPKSPEKGILSVKLLDNSKYELLKDLTTYEIIGIFFDISPTEAETVLHTNYGTSYSYFNEIDRHSNSLSYSNAFADDKKVPLLFSQVTYINSGVFDVNRTYPVPPLDKARQAYRQLILIEDGVLIYRVARSPERLVFNIASGNTSGQKAQQQLLQMVKRFNQRKTTKTSSGERGITNEYDPHQVVESYWFLKPDGTEGSSVESIGGSSDFGELEDLKFFTRKLYRSLKVPFSRFEQPENTISQGEDITYEEYKFAKFVKRLQQQIASGINESFRTHLKLKKLWEQYKISNRDLDVIATPPALYELYQTAKLNELKMEAYSSIADNDKFSYTLAMKKILNMSEDEIEENDRMLDIESEKQAVREYWAEKVSEYGSREKAEKAIAQEEQEDSEEDDSPFG
tara:strand:+ start:22723 stop:24396 length:1674 start_codon:yes stop_codon:yes gene_type:complete